jgi:hypothetical protein
MVTLHHYLPQSYFGQLNLNVGVRTWEDNERSRTPKTTKILTVQQMVLDDRRIKVKNVAEVFGIVMELF